MKKTNVLIIAFICLIVLSLTGCASNKDTTSYQTPLGEVAYLADIDYKLKAGNITDDIVVNIKLNNNSGKSVSAEIGYYEDEYAKKEFTAVKSMDKKVLSTESITEFKFDEDVDNTNNNLYLVIHVGTSLDDNQKAYRKTELLISFDTSNPFVDLDTTEENLKFAQSRYANTLFLTETITDTSVVDKVVLNQLSGVTDFFADVFGYVLYFFVDKVFGGIYWIGLLVFTLLLRTLGWPIYAKTNATSQGMSKIQPEIDKLNKKYEGKTDQNSKMKQQMEMREIMKKNKVSMWGCLLPFVQMPIFIVVYQMVRKFPCTPKYDYIDYNFLGANLGAVQGNPEGNVVLALLVGATMIATQLLSTYFQKRQQKKRENFYTKQKATSQKQANMTLIIMTVVMTVMMVAFAWNSAGMAFYWIIGNVYQLGQTFISKIIQEKKEEKEELKTGKVRGRD